MTKVIKIQFLIVLSVISFFIFQGTIRASEYNCINDLTNQIRYDSNVLFSRSDEVEDWIYEVIPKIGIERRDELSNIKAQAKFRGQLFFKEDSLNTLDQDYSFYFERYLTERFSFNFNAYYIIDTTTDRELLETGTLLTRNDRTHYSVSPSFNWSVSETDTVSITMPFIWTNYDGNQYVDYRTTYFTTTYTHLLQDRRTSIIIQPQYAYLKFDNSETDLYDIMIGFSRQETERLDWGVLTGMNYTESTYDAYRYKPITEQIYVIEKYEDTSYNIEWVAMAHVNWKYETGSIKTRFLRTVSESGYGEAVTRMRLTTRIDHKWTYRFSSFLKGQYSRVEDQASGRRVDYAIYGISPGCNYKLTENITIGLYYRYTLEDSKRLNDTYDRHIFCLQFDIIDVTRLF